MVDKLESLATRLEKVTGRLESIQADKLENLVNRLERAIGQVNPSGTSVTVQAQPQSQSQTSVTPAQSQPQAAAFNAFDSVYNDLEDKAKATGNQDLINLTNIALQVFRWTDAIIAASASSKKPANDVIAKLQKFFGDKAKEIDQNYIHPRKLENHGKAVKEGLGAALWIYTEGPAPYIEGVIEPVTYSINKVKMQKAPGEVEWADKFLAVLRAFKAYTKENYPTGLIWKGKQEGDFSQLIEGKISSVGVATTSTSAPAQNVQATTSAAPAQSQQATNASSAFETVYSELEEKAKATGNQDLINLTNTALHIFRWTDAIVATSKLSKKPSNDVIGKLQKIYNEKSKEIDSTYIFPRKLENQGKTVKEGLAAVLWIYTDAPVSYIDGVLEPTLYSGNKVKMAKAAGEPEWVDKFVAVLRKIKENAKENHSTGLIWKGKTDEDFSQLVEGKVPSAGGATTVADPLQGSRPEQPNRAALFSELNKGSSVTTGLKVADRKPKGQVSEQPPLEPLSKKPVTATQQPAKVDTKPPKTPNKYFKDNWFIENFTDDRTITLDEADMREGVYIDNCHKSVVTIKGKVKSIMISNCSNFGLIFDNVVSTVEAVNTKGLTIQAKGHAPSVVLDKCERVKVYLAKDLGTDIVSSKVTELNISYLQDDDDYAKEFPVTEQFVTRWDPKANKFVTKPLDIFIM